MRIDELEITIFDTETTGLEPKNGDRIVEIAAARIKHGKIIATFQSLINPQRKISEAAFAVNKITQEMLQDAPGIDKVLPEFMEFVGGSYLCSYNAAFDIDFLKNELELLGQKIPDEIIIVDVLKMARRLLPGLERYALWFVSEKLGIKTKQEHRAFSDVEMTLAVFNILKGLMAKKGIDDTEHFKNLFTINTKIINNLVNQKVSEIQEAIDLKVKLRIRYLSGRGAEISEREVVPKEIKEENGKIYFVAYCNLRNEERTFRIDGILHLEII